MKSALKFLAAVVPKNWVMVLEPALL